MRKICTIILSFIYIFSFFSCSNLQNFSDESLENTNTCIVHFLIQENGNSSRTIVPTTADTTTLLFTLKGAETGEAEQTVLPTTSGKAVEYMAWEELSKASFRLSAGNWDFTLEGYAKKGDRDYIVSGTLNNQPIVSGSNSIKFPLSPNGSGEGSVDITLSYTLGADSESKVTNVVVTLTKKDDGSKIYEDTWEGTDTDVLSVTLPDNGTGFIKYKKSAVKSDTYLSKFSITSTIGENTSTKKESYRSDTLVVATGCESKKDDLTIVLNQMYSITYEGMESAEHVSYWKENVDKPEFYSPYESTTLPTKDDMKRDDAAFIGWYTNAEGTGDKILKTPINTISPGPLTYYAKWLKNERYVSAAGDDATDSGSKEKPYQTLAYALGQLADGNLGWTIYIIGEITENVIITTDSSKAKQIIIEGETGSSTNSIIGKADGNSVLTVSTDVPVILRKITVKGGKGTDLAGTGLVGGGLYLNATNSIDISVTLGADSVVKDNTAQFGGGAYVKVGTLYLEGTSFTGNSSTDGAGLFVADTGNVIIDSGSVKSNIASNNGGGIYNAGKLKITGSQDNYVTLSDNTALAGGAVYSNGTLFNVSYATVNGNSATNGKGGAIYASGSTNTITNSVIKNNTADDSGGGIFTSGATNTISNTEITGNSATNGSGGGIYTSGTTNTITNTEITGNSATNGSGGGIYTTGTLTLTSSKVGASEAANTAVTGGGIYNTGDLTVTGTQTASSTINYNTASANSEAGAGIFNENILTLQGNSGVSNNTAENGNGGAIYNAGSFTMQTANSCYPNITGNNAVNGAGVYSDGNTATFKMSAGSIASNTASSTSTTTQGGGVYNGATMFLYDKAVIGAANPASVATDSNHSNSATNGGGIYNKGVLNIGYSDDGVEADYTEGIYYNYATSGAGIYTEGSQLNMRAGVVSYNYATENGGGIYNENVFNFTGGSFEHNRAKTAGGGAYNNKTMIMIGTAVIGDSSSHTQNATKTSRSNYAANGGGIYNNTSCSLTLGNQTALTGGVYYNYASTDGGGIVNVGSLTITSGYVLYNGVAEPAEEGDTTVAGVLNKTNQYTVDIPEGAGEIQPD
ncbi:hypothetical protein MSI_11090 [Treponema sp. JC4]|uniref:beta strand repeat-containing protein n=1 Tax=Treponema sp. JC4 TaxID=1124982 RepID=UPI00025B0DEC|nr:right-handed parallel beta-helix repeat-containing protein [Treponema sp. JC4]EID85391.1 hypothetical protein MSI_11090 [Treponema sp. JC4]